jgi:hypothetical protein
MLGEIDRVLEAREPALADRSPAAARTPPRGQPSRLVGRPNAVIRDRQVGVTERPSANCLQSTLADRPYPVVRHRVQVS